LSTMIGWRPGSLKDEDSRPFLGDGCITTNALIA